MRKKAEGNFSRRHVRLWKVRNLSIPIYLLSSVKFSR
jgi:hypothetical protein